MIFSLVFPLAMCLVLTSELLIPSQAAARITKIELLAVESPTFAGREFGEVGVLNRGNKIDLVLLNNVPYGETTNTPKTADDAGNGFLMRQGYRIVWSGWQLRGKPGAQCCVPNEPGRMGAELPIPLENGKPISGSVRDLFVGQQQSNPPGHQTVTLSYPVASLDPKQMQVGVRAKATDEKPQKIPCCNKTHESSPFGQPGRTQGAHQDFGFPENWFPFAYGKHHDALTGKQDGVLRAGSGKPGDGFDPLILVTNTASEYWRKSAALLHTDGHGNDISIPDSVRLYFFASTQHFALFPSPITTSLAERLPKGPCQHEHNPAFRGPVMRALLVALHDWVYAGTLPPKSQIPTRREGTLVTAEESIKGFPPIPGVTHVTPSPRLALGRGCCCVYC